MQQIRSFVDERVAAFCAFCGGPVSTRDHVPPRAFLDEPYPDNLPVVPSCETCNNQASVDEAYVACLIDCVISGTTDPNQVGREKVKRILEQTPALRARLEASRNNRDDGTYFEPEAERVGRVVRKLAQGHMAYENGDPPNEEPTNIWFGPLVTMTDYTRSTFELPPQPNMWPEVGSRAMTRLAHTWPEQWGWITVQPGRYRFLVSVGHPTIVRVVCSEYLAGEVVWE